MNLFWMSLAGAAGTLARYGVYVAMEPMKSAFPWPTLVVNGVGSLLFGIIMGKAQIDPQIRGYLLTGFMGAFTTFSTFAYDTSRLSVKLAIANVAAQVVVGIVLVIAGLWIGERI